MKNGYGMVALAVFFSLTIMLSSALAQDEGINGRDIAITNYVNNSEDCATLAERVMRLEARVEKLEALIYGQEHGQGLGEESGSSDARNFQAEAVELAMKRGYRQDSQHILVYIPPFVSESELNSLKIALDRCYRGDVEKTVRGVFQGRIKSERKIIGPNIVEWRD